MARSIYHHPSHAPKPGGKVLAIIQKLIMKKFKDRIHENETYLMSFFGRAQDSISIHTHFFASLSQQEVLLGVDMMDLKSKDEGENVEEDTSYEEDPVMEPEIIEEDSSQDSSEESY
ncbi:hypothetical protein JHK82_040107 [Glycine max]|nr:hypothetical protein JHK86_040302 [Glycine max]KAG5110884.1 hypothetical protein JHK82_040107 [Glycine max]KAG5122180.1 hypothetical protein JHK84_040520 [Glycine max]